MHLDKRCRWFRWSHTALVLPHGQYRKNARVIIEPQADRPYFENAANWHECVAAVATDDILNAHCLRDAIRQKAPHERPTLLNTDAIAKQHVELLGILRSAPRKRAILAILGTSNLQQARV